MVTAMGTLSFGAVVLFVLRIVAFFRDPARRMAKLKPKGLRSHSGDEVRPP